MYSYLNNLYQPLIESSNVPFNVGLYDKTGRFVNFRSINNFNELCLALKDMVLSSNNIMNVLVSSLDSLRENNVQWIDEENINNPSFKMILWPDTIINLREGICQDFALFMYCICKRFNLQCNLVFLAFMDTDGNYQYGHTYPIIKVNGKYWFWNFTSDLSSIHGEYDSLEDAYFSSSEYFRSIFSALNMVRYNPYNAVLTNKPKIMFKACIKDEDMEPLMVYYNKSISRIEFWNNLDALMDMRKDIISKYNDIFINRPKLPLSKNINFGIDNFVFRLPVSKFKLYTMTKKLGHVFHISK